MSDFDEATPADTDSTQSPEPVISTSKASTSEADDQCCHLEPASATNEQALEVTAPAEPASQTAIEPITSDSASTELPSASIVPQDGNDQPDSPKVDLRVQVRLHRQDDRLVLTLPAGGTDPQAADSEFTWTELQHQLQQRLIHGEPFWQPGMAVDLVAYNRLLTDEQLQAMAEILATVELTISRVLTNHRQTAITAATAGYSVEQSSQLRNPLPETGIIQAEPLYLQNTLRSGVEVCHPGSVIVYGDTNPGSTIIANGDVLIWGRLRGVVQAGATGNVRACIMALRIEPPAQLRIADYRARAPKPPDQWYPEVVYVANRTIRIIHANEFSRPAYPAQ
ncbi:MAG: septum site-determining protein MinC [Cyanobacteriota bacterium SKYGB_h_bin112]|nr:septum site-determining protein MinC [Cyanobacteriota bacterium SKYGB_h_bin112]